MDHKHFDFLNYEGKKDTSAKNLDEPKKCFNELFKSDNKKRKQPAKTIHISCYIQLDTSD